MKKIKTALGYQVSLGRLPEVFTALPHPERTAYKQAGAGSWDYVLCEFPNRESMALAIRLQEKRERRSTDYKAVQPLHTVEGFPGWKRTTPVSAP